MYGPLSPDESALIARLPPILRARGYRLYAQDGSRWLDCWAEGGRALAGHKPTGLSLRLKNEIDRGLYAAYPNRWTGRLAKAVGRMFPGYPTIRVYRNAERAFAAAGLNGMPVDPLDLPPGGEWTDDEKVRLERGKPDRNHLNTAFWGRPLLSKHPKGAYLFPILPFPGLSEAQAVLAAEPEAPLPESDSISPVVLAGLTRSCGLPVDRFTVYSSYLADIWERRGPYLLYRGHHDAYPALFESMFARRILIAPSPSRPSIMPADMSAPEKKTFGFGSSLP